MGIVEILEIWYKLNKNQSSVITIILNEVVIADDCFFISNMDYYPVSASTVQTLDNVVNSQYFSLKLKCKEVAFHLMEICFH